MKNASQNLATAKNLALLFRGTTARFPEKKSLLYKESGKFTSLTWAEFQKRVNAVAGALIERGFQSGDRLAILSENRPEWAIVDLAAQHLGVITVPIYTSLSPAEIEYLLVDCGAKMAAVSNKILFEKIAAIQKKLPALVGIIGFEASLAVQRNSTTIPLYFLKDWEKGPSDSQSVGERAEAVAPDAVATIIYTSGTTGEPKGVMLTNGNFIHNVMMAQEALKMGETDRHLSFLPLSHVFERMAGHYLMIAIGATIAYAESMDTVRADLLDVRPTFLLGVPRFYEKIKEHVLQTVQSAPPLKRGLFFWAKELGAERRKALAEKRPANLFLKIETKIAEILVYKKFKNSLGGRLRYCISGGAPLAREVAEFFCDMGVMIYEGYGLTETSPVISVNREGRFKFGSVGIPLQGVRVHISEEGEILTKSPSVMKGYYRKQEETQAALKDGWFLTGDLGQIDRDGFLVITGRKKELIVTSGGKKVAPRSIEENLEKDPFILRCVLFGEGRKCITAFIVPEEGAVLEHARREKIAFKDYPDLLRNPQVYRFFERRIEALCKDLASYERIKYFALLERDFSQSAGELTPTLKVKRDVIAHRYQDRLLPFYEIN